MNTKFLPAVLLAIVCSLAIFSCKKVHDNSIQGDYTQGYFPLGIGRYVVYQVDSIVWDDFNHIEKEKMLQMRYTVTDSFRDEQNRLSFQIDIHQRVADTGQWQEQSVIYVTSTGTTLEYVQNNLRFIKLIFPVNEGYVWNGNSYISTSDPDNQYFSNWLYKYQNVAKGFSNNYLTFNNTVTVNEVNDSLNNPETLPTAYADRTYAQEVYGYNVGLIYREMTHWVYDPGVTTYRSGYSVKMWAIDHN